MSEAGIQLTAFLDRARAGDEQAREEVVARIYPELRRIADARMRSEQAPRTLQVTALVNEAYLRLFGKPEQVPEDTRGFLAAASRAMQRILVEEARRRNALKRGGGERGVTLNELGVEEDDVGLDAERVEAALAELEQENAEIAEVVRLRYFAGLSPAQVAHQLATSESTVFRQWRFARAWLMRRLGDGQDGARATP